MGTKERLKELEDKVTKGLEEAYKRMVKFKRYKSSPIVISKDGKVVRVNADEIQLDGEK